MIFAQPSNIALYCAQVLEGRLEERRSQEEEILRREEEEARLAQEKHQKAELAKEDFRKKSKNVTAKRNCESQTGFTTDSGKTISWHYNFLNGLKLFPIFFIPKSATL